SPGNFAVRRSSNFDITDAALLPGGDVLLLERRFSWSSGLAVRMRRVALGEIKPGAVVDGPILFDADLGYEIDNMEGLSLHRSRQTRPPVHFGRQFLRGSAHAAASVHAGGAVVQACDASANAAHFRGRLTRLPPLFSF